MNNQELRSLVVKKANEIHKELTKSLYTDKKLFEAELYKRPFCYVEGNARETINNLSAKIALSLEY